MFWRKYTVMHCMNKVQSSELHFSGRSNIAFRVDKDLEGPPTKVREL